MIFAIVGKSGTGKTTLIKNIAKSSDLPVVVQYTTRPKRYGEVHGVDYNFTNYMNFVNMVLTGKMATNQSFEVAKDNATWSYGYKKQDIEKHKDCILIANPRELEQLKREYKDVYVIELAASIQTRTERYFKRDEMTQGNVCELVRRMIRDEQDFAGIKSNITVNGENSNLEVFQKVMNIIKKEIKVSKPAKKRLYFYTGVMKSGKSEILINRIENDMDKGVPYLALKPVTDTRDKAVIKSRNGKSIPCQTIKEDTNIYEVVRDFIVDNGAETLNVYIDEVQFLSQSNIRELLEIIKKMKFVNIYCAGLTIDFKGEAFHPSSILLHYADRIVKKPYPCECCGENNATNHLLKVDGKVVKFEDFAKNQIAIEKGRNTYQSVCIDCYIKQI